MRHPRDTTVERPLGMVKPTRSGVCGQDRLGNIPGNLPHGRRVLLVLVAQVNGAGFRIGLPGRDVRNGRSLQFSRALLTIQFKLNPMLRHGQCQGDLVVG